MRNKCPERFHLSELDANSPSSILEQLLEPLGITGVRRCSNFHAMVSLVFGFWPSARKAMKIIKETI